ncbi:MAG: putative LPS assembly protein LptD [Crocinitomicaceae bacterium]|nr:LPS-assembly protein LptD [Crocinitomicaceae bacterium]
MLISVLFAASYSFAQNDLDGPVKYEARDSIIANIPRQTVMLYGEAYVSYEGIELKADYIEINTKNSEVIATFTTDSSGNPVGKPIFISEGEESRCDYIKYNFETKKGYVREVRAQQDEGYIHMAESKIHPNEEIHLKNGKFTTCDLDTPHYHFKLTRAIIVPDQRIVTGPVYMKLFKIPTPLAAPFAFFPNSDSKKHGIIIPSFASSPKAGYGLQDFGYYIPIGDYWETQFNGTIYTSGRFAVGNITNYKKKYRYTGSFGLNYQYLKGYFYDTVRTSKVSVDWTHTQDPKAHPSLTFSGNIKFMSDNNGKNTLQTYNPDYFTNQFNSALSLTKRWKTKRFNGNASIKTSLQQNSVAKTYTLNLPELNLAVSRFDLGVFRKNKVGKKWFEEIKVQYGMKSKNFISAPDSIFNVNDYNQVGDYAVNGVEQNVTLNSNLKIFGGRFTFTPQATYREFWNFQYEDHEWNDTDQKVDTTKLKGFANSREVNFTAGLTSSFYGIYKLKTERETRFKHVATPNLSFNYRPDLTLYKEVQYDADSNTRMYSPFVKSLYKEPGAGESGKISFSLANTLKMKTRNMNDTINETDKTFNLIDALGITSSYDIFKDSFNLDPFNLSFRTSKLFKVISFQSSGQLSPYAYDSLNIERAQYAWKNKQGVGVFKNMNLVVGANFTSKNGRKKQEELSLQTENNAAQNGIVTNPNKVSFDIPWQLNVSYNLKYTRVLKDTFTDRNYNAVQTIKFDGDFSINEKWKIGFLTNFDLQQFLPAYQSDAEKPYKNLVTNYNINLWRDLHCWEATLQWGQTGPWSEKRFTFLFRVNIKASMFQDIKLEWNQPPIFF